MRPHRRRWLAGAAGGALALALGRIADPARAAAQRFEIARPAGQWRARLAAEQYAVLREAATERAVTSPLNHEQRRGTFNCAGCALALFSSDTKFDSGTG